MIDTLEMYRQLQQTMDSAAAEKIVEIIGLVYEELRDSVTKTEFNALKDVVTELAEAQRRTEQRVAELTEAQKELAEAQRRTEQRVDTLAQRMEELAEAQRRTDQRVAELAEAQQRTEQRVAELAEAQQRTEQRVAELAEAQKQTQQEVRLLTQELSETRNDLGGLARSVSYALENEAYRMVPALLKERYDVEIIDRLIRTEIGEQEINLFGRGRRNGQDILVVGEIKLRLDERRKKPGQKDVFEQLETKAEAVRAVYPNVEILPLIVTHFARPKILEQARAKGIIVVQSFEW